MINPVWNPFSRYADKLEKKLDRLLRRVAFLGIFAAQEKILALMQEHLVIVNLWLEAKFKGYKYLSRSRRKRMYANAEKIAAAFLTFANASTIDLQRVKGKLASLGLPVPGAPGDDGKLVLLTQIMEFLRPHAGRFEYLEGASFGKLLTDPDRGEKMIGDCNQIVTFYAFLYSLKYPLQDLRIKLVPGHVCLHFKGIDVEATAGSFARYDKDAQVLPIVELIATNLLDVSDFRDKQIQVEPREFLRGAQLAYNLSSDRELVNKNLKAAYHNVAVESLKSQQFDTAVFFLEKAGLDSADEIQTLQTVYHNAVLYHVKQHSFSKARSYAGKSSEADLRKYVDEREALYLYEKGSLVRARELFERAGNRQMVKACYAKEYNALQSRVAGLKDLATMRSHRGDYQKMLGLAVKMEDQALADNLRRIIGQL